MSPRTTLRTLGVAAPLAVAALLAAAPQAVAGVADAAVNNPQVVDQGGKLAVDFTSAVSDQTADAAEAREVAAGLVGDWAGQLVDQAERDNPPRNATCQATATATDPNGATGTASVPVPTGYADTMLQIPDQAPGTTKWGVGDLDHFTVNVTCTDMTAGGGISKAVIDEDAIAS